MSAPPPPPPPGPTRAGTPAAAPGPARTAPRGALAAPGAGANVAPGAGALAAPGTGANVAPGAGPADGTGAASGVTAEAAAVPAPAARAVVPPGGAGADAAGVGAGASAEAAAVPGPAAGADPARALVFAFAEDEAAVRRCRPVFAQLRPRLGGEEEFAARWRAQAAEGYRILFAAEEGEDGAVRAAAGFRIMTTLAWGRSLYLDDLIVDGAARGRGLGSALLGRLREIAVAEGCGNVQLDTGHQRHAAHRSYLRNGYYFSCHHLSLDLDGD